MDRRIEKTRNSLINALPALMRTHDWHDINVQRLCDQANVSRSAFYTHFNNKAEVLDLCFERLAQELAEPNGKRGIDSHGTFAFLPNLLNHVHSHCDLLRRNASSPAGLVILNRFKSTVQEMANQEVRESKTLRLSKDQARFITGGIFAMIEQWNAEHCATSVQALTRRIDALVGSFVSAQQSAKKKI